MSSIKLTGVDDLGRTISYIETYNKKTGELKEKNTVVSEEFAKIAAEIKKAGNEQEKANKAWSNYVNIINKIKTHNVKVGNESEYVVSNIDGFEDGEKTYDKETFNNKSLEDRLVIISNLTSALKINSIQFEQVENKAKKSANAYSKYADILSKIEILNTEIEVSGSSVSQVSSVTKYSEQELSKNDFMNRTLEEQSDIVRILTENYTKAQIAQKDYQKSTNSTADSTAQLTYRFEECQKDFEILQAKIKKSNIEGGILQQSPTPNESSTLTNYDKYLKAVENFKGNKTVENLTEVKHWLSMINKEYSLLNAQMTSEFSTNEIENLKIKVETAEDRFASLKATYNKLGNKTDTVKAKFIGLETALTNLSTAQKEYNDNTSSENLEAYITESEKFERQLKTTTSAVKRLKDEERQSLRDTNFILNQQNLNSRIETYMQKNTIAARKYGEELKRLKDLASEATNALELKEVETGFADLQEKIREAGDEGKSFVEKIKEAASKFTQWMSLTNVISSCGRLLQQMITNVIEIDGAMTSLKKVTDETDYSYNRFLSNATKNAQNLHSKVSDLVEQTSVWAKLGFDMDTSSELAKISMIYSKVGEVDNETAVSDLVTAMKAFNIEADKSITIVDSLNKLGNEFATSASDLGEGLSNSASSLAVAGNDMHQSLAMLTGGAEITQNAGELGNSLKVISMRVRGMKGDLEAIGEEYENIESVSKIQTQIYNLTQGKVNIFDENENFKSTYEILEQVSKVYNDLTDTDRASLTEILFGKQRANQGVAIIQAFQSGQIQKALDASVNSANSAQTEFDKWGESLEAKLNNVQSAFESLSDTVVNSDLISFGLDTLTGFINGLNDIVKTLGEIPILITTIVTALSMKNVGEQNLNTPVLMLPQIQGIGNATRFKIRLSNCWEMLMAV